MSHPVLIKLFNDAFSRLFLFRGIKLSVL